MSAARLEGAGKVYGEAVKTLALKPISLEISQGEMTLLLGPSGSGKTTLLNLLGGLDQPSEGRVTVEGQDLTGLDPKGLTLFRRKCVGFVFQFFNLVQSLTAKENVQLSSELVGEGPAEAEAWLNRVGLEGLGDRFPAELSGGQQQRVAIARALAKNPKLLLADEPTGALDHESGNTIIELLKAQATQRGCAVVVVTHNRELAAWADRVISLRDGEVVNDVRTSMAGAP